MLQDGERLLHSKLSVCLQVCWPPARWNVVRVVTSVHSRAEHGISGETICSHFECNVTLQLIPLLPCRPKISSTCCFNYLRKRSDPPHRPAQVVTASHSHATDSDPPGIGHTTGGDSAIALTHTEIVQLKRLLKLLPAELGSAVQSAARANRSPLMAVWLATVDPATGRSRAAAAAPHTECYQLNDKHYCVETVSGNAIKWGEL